MEFIINNQAVLENVPALSPNGVGISSSSQPFIEANTIAMPVQEIKDQHIIPVWAANNEPLISHSEFVEATWEVANRMFKGDTLLKPSVRVSHPIKGRIPEAKNKPAKELQPWEQTIFYERMMFVIEIPTIMETIEGNPLSLTLGGVKSYSLDNLYGKRSHGDQHFQLFIGFQNRVCCNLCVWSDGVQEEVGIKSVSQLYNAVQHLIRTFDSEKQIRAMKSFGDYEINETEFAQIIGRARMYKHLHENDRKDIPELLLGDQQMGTVVRDYYHDKNFGHDTGGIRSLWDFYNLLTGANKSTYIDAFVNRGVNAYDFTNGVAKHKQGEKAFWYMG